MGLIFGLLKRLFKLSLYLFIVAAIIVLIPNLPPYTKFTSIKLEPTLPSTGPLAPNDALNNAEQAYVDKLLGPEAFQVHKGDLYTSLATGEIVKVSPGGHVTFVTKLGQPCSGLVHEHICGRPLGFQIDEKNDMLYVADAYQGIWKVDLKNDKKQLLVSPRAAIQGRQPKLFNSLALGKNGDLYWTDSSSDFHLKDGALSILADPSGRLFHYNAAKNESKVLLDDLWFPNGVVVSPDNQFVVVAETGRFRIMKYYIDGPKKGKSEVFIAGLPGVPDNMRALPDGSGALAALYSAGGEREPLLQRSLAGAALARKLAARAQRLAELSFEYLHAVYPHPVLEDIIYHIGHFKSVSGLSPQMTGLVQIDWDGNVVASYFNNDGSLKHISDAIVYNGRLYTGNPHAQNFIGSVPVPPLLKKAFETKTENAPKQQVRPVETPKAKVEEKPKVEAKRNAPKPAVQEKPAKQQIKPTNAEKPAPVNNKPTPKPVEQPKPVQPKPITPPPARTELPNAQEPKPTPKPEIKTTLPPSAKPVPKSNPPSVKPEAKAAPEAKATTPKPVQKTKPAETKPVDTKPKESQKPVKEDTKPNKKPEQIPIKEEIPSDTAKPPKETLKVIKKGGPAEIPNPNL